jgi:hypothetical protein
VTYFYLLYLRIIDDLCFIEHDKVEDYHFLVDRLIEAGFECVMLPGRTALQAILHLPMPLHKEDNTTPLTPDSLEIIIRRFPLPDCTVRAFLYVEPSIASNPLILPHSGTTVEIPLTQAREIMQPMSTISGESVLPVTRRLQKRHLRKGIRPIYVLPIGKRTNPRSSLNRIVNFFTRKLPTHKQR